MRAYQGGQGLAGKVIVGGCQQKAQELKGENGGSSGKCFFDLSCAT